MQQRLQTTPEHNASIKVKHLINNCKPGENAPGLASLEGAWIVNMKILCTVKSVKQQS